MYFPKLDTAKFWCRVITMTAALATFLPFNDAYYDVITYTWWFPLHCIGSGWYIYMI